jgi:competence protein CoiA
MKFALVNGEKSEATKGAKGLCPSCGAELIARCGEVKINHWAHKGKRSCDPWWENETEWHRAWKNEFPTEWQEVVHYDENGEKHIADVKTQTDWVIEFQHSYLKPEERHSRNIFYNKLVWVVDGSRRKTDKKQFSKILKEESRKIIEKPPTIRVHFPEDCRLLIEWSNSNSFVFFDFNGSNENENLLLWLLYPNMRSGNIYLSYITRSGFTQLSNNDGFDKLVRDVITPMHKEILPMYEAKHRPRV